MAGFVVFEEDRAWGVSNAGWRATILPLLDVLPVRSEAHALIADAERPHLHFLDLCDTPPETRAALRRGLVKVRSRYADGRLSWGEGEDAFLRYFDALLRMFDDPDFGRPMWPPPRR